METMNSISQIEKNLSDAGFTITRDHVGDAQLLIARVAKFRVQWFLTRLHLFMMLKEFDHVPTRSELDQFLSDSTEYARKNKGGMIAGLQTGSAVIPVAIVPNAGAEQTAWAEKVHGRKFAAIPFPALADLSAKHVTYPKRMTVGAIYLMFLKSVLRKYIVPAVQQG